VIYKVLSQQQQIFHTKKTVPDRIVSIAKNYVRPIIRGKEVKAGTELNEILWIFFGIHTANAVRIAKRLAQEKQSELAA